MIRWERPRRREPAVPPRPRPGHGTLVPTPVRGLRVLAPLGRAACDPAVRRLGERCHVAVVVVGHRGERTGRPGPLARLRETLRLACRGFRVVAFGGDEWMP